MCRIELALVVPFVVFRDQQCPHVQLPLSFISLKSQSTPIIDLDMQPERVSIGPITCERSHHGFKFWQLATRLGPLNAVCLLRSKAVGENPVKYCSDCTLSPSSKEHGRFHNISS